MDRPLAVTVLGYPAAYARYGTMGLLPSNVWTILLRLLLPPLALPFAGLGTIAGLAATVAALTAVLVWLIYQVPLFLVDYFSERGNRAHIRRQLQQWLLQYIENFRLWLFGLPMRDQPEARASPPCRK